MKTAMARRPILRRRLLSLAWLGVSLAFAHLFLDSTGPRSVDVHGCLAAAAAVALLLAAASCFGHGPRLGVVSGVAAMLTTLVALGLVAVGAAHETGMTLVVGGAVIAVVSMMPLEPGHEAKARFDGDRP